MLISIINKNDNIHKTSSRNQMNIDKYRVASNITEYYIISKLIFLVCKNFKISKFKWTYGLSGHNYRVATLSTLDITVLGIIIPSLKSTRQF